MHTMYDVNDNVPPFFFFLGGGRARLDPQACIRRTNAPRVGDVRRTRVISNDCHV